MSRLGRCRSVALAGVQGTVVTVEAHLGGMPAFTIVGLPDTSLSEARERVRAAVLSSGVPWPLQRITVSLSPGALPKRGSHFDLALALTVLEASDAVPAGALTDVVVLGELGLDGRVRGVQGVLPALLSAVRAGCSRAVVPLANAAEAELVPGVQVVAVASLRHAVALLRGEPVALEDAGPLAVDAAAPGPGSDEGGPATTAPARPMDLADVAGQREAKVALEVAAAGRHHLSMTGPPGAGKTMLAQRLPGLLPDLEIEEALEVSAIHSVAGLLPGDQPLLTRPPFADPHHTASVAAVVGGGSRHLRPGAASQAHRGVLFLDEAPEFGARVLDALRQPLEHGEIVLARAEASAVFPARFQLVLAANPCSCGNATSRVQVCRCPPAAVARYAHRVSGPVRDRIDLHLQVPPPSLAELEEGVAHGESSAVVAERVAAARARQDARLADTPWRVNAEVPGRELRRRYPVPVAALRPVSDALRRGRLTARGADRVVRVAWTIADLRGHDRPDADDVESAVALRQAS